MMNTLKRIRRYGALRKSVAAEGGFTLLEVMISIGLLSFVFMGVSGGVLSGLQCSQETIERNVIKNRAQIYLNRVMSLNFGSSSDSEPTDAQLNELFDDDADIGTVTLASLAQAPEEDDGWVFTLNDFPVEGSWCVAVDQDLNADGSVEGTVEESGKLVRITVFFDDETILWTIRGKEIQT